MKQENYKKAESLAKRPYQVQVFPDEFTFGNPLFVAIVPELRGCVTHGHTAEEAKREMSEVIVEFIYFMLEDQLEIPGACANIFWSDLAHWQLCFNK